MEDHRAIPIMRPSHRRAIDYFERAEFKPLAYGLPKEIELNALDSLRALEEKSVRSQLKFDGEPRDGNLTRSDKQKNSGTSDFSDVESFSDLEALGERVTELNGFGYPESEVRCPGPEEHTAQNKHSRRNHTKRSDSVRRRRFKNVRRSALRKLRVVEPRDSINREGDREMANVFKTISWPCDEVLHTDQSDVFMAIESNHDEEPLPDITSFSDLSEVLASFSVQL